MCCLGMHSGQNHFVHQGCDLKINYREFGHETGIMSVCGITFSTSRPYRVINTFRKNKDLTSK